MKIVKLPNGNRRELSTDVYHQLKHKFTVYHREYSQIHEWTLSIRGTHLTNHLFAELADNTWIGVHPNADNCDSTVTVSTDDLQKMLTTAE